MKIGNEPLGELAGHMLFRLRRLQVGQSAPDIVGVDQHGQPMKLSDYRGKVIAIVFWGSWCSVCMHSVPAERDLVKRMQGKPFVLLGVNSDPRGKVDEVIEKNQINWRSWADRELEGPQVIAKAWDVRSWPQIYLLDDAGVIRYSELAYGTSGQELGQAVDLLVSEVK